MKFFNEIFRGFFYNKNKNILKKGGKKEEGGDEQQVIIFTGSYPCCIVSLRVRGLTGIQQLAPCFVIGQVK